MIPQITHKLLSPTMFSICTLISDRRKYGDLLASLAKHGFVNEVDEILSIDNIGPNCVDAYRAILDFSTRGTGKYLLIVHQDVIFNQPRQALVDAIEKTIRRDPLAAVFGVAGTGMAPFRGSGHFFQGEVEKCWGFRDAGLVQSLDECFLIIRNGHGINVSSNLEGFHFYGTDLCVNASRLGYRCYVIDYPITHLSSGKLDLEYYKARDRFESHLNSTLTQTWYIYTTCSVVYAGQSILRSALAAALSQVMVEREDHPDTRMVQTLLYEKNRMSYGVATYVSSLCVARLIFLWHDLSSFLFWKIIYPASWPLRRACTDAGWWLKNWRSRIFPA